jgi:gliding motility-associated-like protein
VCSASEQLVNLNLITPIAVDVPNEVIVSYHDSQNDAINNSNALDQMYFFTTTTDLYLRVETIETGCVSTYGFELLVSEPPRAYQPDPMVLCDDDYDGMLAVNLSDQTEDIIGAQFAENLEVSYHLTETDAIEGVNHLPIEYTASDADIIFARIFNVNTGCWDTTYFYIFINPLPVLNIGDQVVCIDNLPLVVSANTGTDTDTYSWSTGASSPEIEITEVGSYWVTVVTEDGCAVTETFNVSESASATIEFTEVLDFSDPNNITITVSGIGDYLYILDEGEPQESNVFEHVSLGYHTITIIDENGCAPITKEVLVIDAPKFFTPNGDGQFDTWHIVGVETLPGTEIHIFDRYGKLLKKLSWNTPGWDGFYRGSKVRADDYWYKALVKRGENSMEVSGHFALRR